MLEKISFRYKLFILPAVCILGLVIWTLRMVSYTRVSNRNIEAIVQSAFPAWEMNRSLRKTLRSTQDAVLKAFLAGDPQDLKNAEATRAVVCLARVLHLLDQGLDLGAACH